MKIRTLSTPIFRIGGDLQSLILNSLEPFAAELEGSVLCVTSKIVSLAQRAVVNSTQLSKLECIKSQADVYLGEVAHGCHLTVKENLFLASAGIDESNSETGDFILLPKDPGFAATDIRNFVINRFRLAKFGVILTDSRTSFLRYGVTGISLGSAGFEVLRDQIGRKDLFGRKLKSTKVNTADALAAAAVLNMGEADEKTPLALITEISPTALEFCPESRQSELYVPMQEGMFSSDLYWPFLEPGFQRLSPRTDVLRRK